MDSDLEIMALQGATASIVSPRPSLTTRTESEQREIEEFEEEERKIMSQGSHQEVSFLVCHTGYFLCQGYVTISKIMKWHVGLIGQIYRSDKPKT